MEAVGLWSESAMGVDGAIRGGRRQTTRARPAVWRDQGPTSLFSQGSLAARQFRCGPGDEGCGNQFAALNGIGIVSCGGPGASELCASLQEQLTLLAGRELPINGLGPLVSSTGKDRGTCTRLQAQRVARTNVSCPHHRRKRHRQGDPRPRHPRLLRPRRQAVRPFQLHRHPARPAREPAVRPPPRRLHRRRSRQPRPDPRRAATAPCSSTRSASSASTCSPSCCASSSRARSTRSASRARSPSTSASSPPPTPTSSSSSSDGRFREDLFYRLNVIRLTIPPLRERRDEIPRARPPLRRARRRGVRKGRVRVAEETMEHLLLFPWPGNVRQLQNELRRMVALAEQDAVLTPRRSRRANPRRDAAGAAPRERPEIAVPLTDKLLPTLAAHRARDDPGRASRTTAASTPPRRRSASRGRACT